MNFFTDFKFINAITKAGREYEFEIYDKKPTINTVDDHFDFEFVYDLNEIEVIENDSTRSYTFATLWVMDEDDYNCKFEESGSVKDLDNFILGRHICYKK